ncbi:hypothetical protein M2103_002145 [Ereboglobus sp. PH5-5]|nr:hypothetical protein [Ereboglobus sp. PH5-10]MDF9833912.1 hypothetical protein [Ereboglobus sp. PH5-5]
MLNRKKEPSFPRQASEKQPNRFNRAKSSYRILLILQKKSANRHS